MKDQRNIYLKMKTLAEARHAMFDAFAPLTDEKIESVSVPEAVNRVLAEAVMARISAPNFHAAAMDGIAVKAEHTFGATETNPKELSLGRHATYVNTGHVMPTDTDAVIMIEHVNILDDQRVVIEAPAFPWQHVRKMGEDIVATELLFPRNHIVTPYCVGALLAGGIVSVTVRQKPKVLIIPTGSELVDWRGFDSQQLKPGQVIESNSWVLGKLTEASGGVYVRHNRLKDDLNQIRKTVEQAISGDFDMVLIIGGSSAGSEDYARPVISQLGQVLLHGVTIMPGKPIIIGTIQSKPVFGIPGYPVSAIICFEQFVKPLLYQMLGQSEPKNPDIEVVPTRKITSKLGVEEFVRVKLGEVNQQIVATPLPRGAGCVTSITEADGIVRIPNHVEGIAEHEPVTAELLRPLTSITNTLVIVGSHDNSLDILADQLQAGTRPVKVSSSHVGSLGGLMAVKKGGCHLAGSHLLDIADGSYNLSYVKKYLGDMVAKNAVRMVHLVFRDQGLIVAKGNPKGVCGVEDLQRDDLQLINRQSGSGTRILLDYHLKQLDIDPARISGYENEEFTHMSVAVAVLGGTADVGMGIYAAAKALDLDFIPVVTEQYDLVVPQTYFEGPLIQILMDTINSNEFKNRVEALGGYHTHQTGHLLL